MIVVDNSRSINVIMVVVVEDRRDWNVLCEDMAVKPWVGVGNEWTPMRVSQRQLW
jgi:hypothetical protein